MSKNQINLEYKGKTYEFLTNRIPGLDGKGEITIRTSEGGSEEIIKGDFRSLHLCHLGDEYFLNGVNLDKLVEELEAEREGKSKRE